MLYFFLLGKYALAAVVNSQYNRFSAHRILKFRLKPSLCDDLVILDAENDTIGHWRRRFLLR